MSLSWYSRMYSQVSIAARMSEGSRLNNDAFVGLSLFVGLFVISVQWPGAEERNSGT